MYCNWCLLVVKRPIILWSLCKGKETWWAQQLLFSNTPTEKVEEHALVLEDETRRDYSLKDWYEVSYLWKLNVFPIDRWLSHCGGGRRAGKECSQTPKKADVTDLGEIFLTLPLSLKEARGWLLTRLTWWEPALGSHCWGNWDITVCPHKKYYFFRALYYCVVCTLHIPGLSSFPVNSSSWSKEASCAWTLLPKAAW